MCSYSSIKSLSNWQCVSKPWDLAAGSCKLINNALADLFFELPRLRRGSHAALRYSSIKFPSDNLLLPYIFYVYNLKNLREIKGTIFIFHHRPPPVTTPDKQLWLSRGSKGSRVRRLFYYEQQQISLCPVLRARRPSFFPSFRHQSLSKFWIIFFVKRDFAPFFLFFKSLSLGRGSLRCRGDRVSGCCCPPFERAIHNDAAVISPFPPLSTAAAGRFSSHGAHTRARELTRNDFW